MNALEYHTHHCAALQDLQRRPVVPDGLVPEHALVPHLDEEAGVKVAELAGREKRKFA